MPLISMISQVQNESKIGQAYKEVGNGILVREMWSMLAIPNPFRPLWITAILSTWLLKEMDDKLCFRGDIHWESILTNSTGYKQKTIDNGDQLTPISNY